MNAGTQRPSGRAGGASGAARAGRVPASSRPLRVGIGWRGDRSGGPGGASGEHLGWVKPALIALSLPVLQGCEALGVHDVQSLLLPRFQRSEIIGFLAGLGTTFAALPDLIAMIRRRSSAGMNPRMAGIMGIFQILWIYYGLLIVSRPIVAWNVVAVVINFLSVGAYVHFVRRERRASPPR